MAHKSLIRGLAVLSVVCVTTTAVLAQGSRSYPFVEVDRNRGSSDVEYDSSLSDVPLAEAGQRFLSGRTGCSETGSNSSSWTIGRSERSS